ncbi:hypothetical protein K439DRAFT_1340599 [Ramaria rubella]|nr:hypothetical protein K439DRAFT_1340599 [Ramaria rubella]
MLSPPFFFEVDAFAGTLFVVDEHKFRSTGIDDTLARLVAALFSAGACNKNFTLTGRKVHGMITDFELFYFFSYDPTSELFYYGGCLGDANDRYEAGVDMISVTNRIFSIVFEAYVEGLEAGKIEKRVSRAVFLLFY